VVTRCRWQGGVEGGRYHVVPVALLHSGVADDALHSSGLGVLGTSASAVGSICAARRDGAEIVVSHGQQLWRDKEPRPPAVLRSRDDVRGEGGGARTGKLTWSQRTDTWHAIQRSRVRQATGESVALSDSTW
jgi:hypothetical protein